MEVPEIWLGHEELDCLSKFIRKDSLSILKGVKIQIIRKDFKKKSNLEMIISCFDDMLFWIMVQNSFKSFTCIKQQQNKKLGHTRCTIRTPWSISSRTMGLMQVILDPEKLKFNLGEVNHFQVTFEEVDCIGEPADASFVIIWPSFTFKAPLGIPLKTRGSISPKIEELLELPCDWTWVRSWCCCCGKRWSWFAEFIKGFWTCAPKLGRVGSIP